jgi:hypothetical protein
MYTSLIYFLCTTCKTVKIIYPFYHLNTSCLVNFYSFTPVDHFKSRERESVCELEGGGGFHSTLVCPVVLHYRPDRNM